MIVIGIAAILMAITTLGIRQASEAFALRRAGTVAVSELRKAQSEAVAEGTGFTVEFVVSDPGSIRVYRENTLVRTIAGEEWPAQVAIVDDGGGSLPALPASTGWLPDCSGPGNVANKCVTFRVLGAPVSVAATTDPIGAVLLRGTGNRWVWVTVAVGTGKASVQR
jgi:hypothetical protein